MGMPLRLGAWLAPLGAAALVAALGTRDPADLPYFVGAANTLFSSAWADTFADPSLQVGPLQLALLWLGDRIGGLAFLAYAIEVGLVALLVFVAGRLLHDRPRCVPAQGLVGLAAVALGLTADADGYGHPAQVAVPLLWVLAGLETRRGRTVRGGALLGLSAGLEVWGLLGAPVLLLAPRVRRAVGGLAAQAALVGALYLPFVLAGEFRMFDYHWKVESGTLVHFLFPAGSEFPWTLRLVQGAAGVLAGAAVALALRRSVRAVWAIPFAVVGVRVLLDPTQVSY
jgi:hypothetical protein